MTFRAIPEDPFAMVPQSPFEPAGHRREEVFGQPVEVLSIPMRGERQGLPGENRKTFQSNRADQIIEAEAMWRAPGMALTGNRYPFSTQQALLWSTERRREPTLDMLEVVFAMEDSLRATSIVNSIGAAGSITRSHVHLIGGFREFLPRLAKSSLDPGEVFLTGQQVGDCEVLRLDPPFPVIAVGVRGDAADRAVAMHHLLECRTTQAFNLVSCDRTAWLIPRSAVEIPAPFFPQALGGAEISGRWICNDGAVFERLSGADMEAALRLGGLSW